MATRFGAPDAVVKVRSAATQSSGTGWAVHGVAWEPGLDELFRRALHDPLPAAAV
jgi:hypothetical protein